MTNIILQTMGQTPSADMVGSMIGVEEEDQFKPRPIMRKPIPEEKQEDSASKDPSKEYRLEIVWRNVMVFVYLHVAAVYGLYLLVTVAKWPTVAFTVWLHLFGGFGITGGAHRLWAHRSYKAKWPLRVLAAIAQTVAVQNDIFEWSRDHRVHHKFSETNADPHNAKRGFFFAHVGWLLCKKHPEVKRRGVTVDVSDLLADPIVRFQRQFYLPLILLLCFALPAIVPWYFWGESLKTAFFCASIFRYILTLNVTWLVNSAAHIWGPHPYDKNISPAENITVAMLTWGEGFHNYHHTFPWDYKAAELGEYSLNLTKFIIDMFNFFGLAYDLKTVPERMIRARTLRTGDGSHPFSFEDSNFVQEFSEQDLLVSTNSDITPSKEA